LETHYEKKNVKNFEILSYVVSCEQNSSCLRKILDELSIADDVPCIPYIGIYLQDLLSLEELNTKDENGLNNFKKMKRIADTVKKFVRFSKVKYDWDLSQSTTLTRYVLSFTGVQTSPEQYRFSYLCEPRDNTK